jgi:SAM-dependent methyltransferase
VGVLYEFGRFVLAKLLVSSDDRTERDSQEVPSHSMTFDYEKFYEPKPPDPAWDGERSNRWNRLDAVVKAEHVAELLKRGQVGWERLSVLDVGCGDGRVLTELAHHGFGPELVGVEVSETAARMARDHTEITRVVTFDGVRLPFADSSFPLAIAMHVLEHVADPLALLQEIRRVTKAFVVIEVPLESNLAARRPRAVALSRSVGHIQRFSRSDVQRLIADAGLTTVSELTDPLSRELRALHDGRVRGSTKWAVRSALTLLPHRERLMTVHYAALAVKRDQ